MTEDEQNDYDSLVLTLKACQLALNAARNFSFIPGANPLGLKVNARGYTTSYDLLSRVDYVLQVTEKRAK